MIGGDVVDPIRCDLAKLQDLKVVHSNLLRIVLTAQLTAGVLEVSERFLILGVDRDRWLARRDGRLHRRVDTCELRIAVRTICTLAGLAVGLTIVFSSHSRLATTRWLAWNPFCRQCLDELTEATVDPAQR
jgi:hypothetical protein